MNTLHETITKTLFEEVINLNTMTPEDLYNLKKQIDAILGDKAAEHAKKISDAIINAINEGFNVKIKNFGSANYTILTGDSIKILVELNH